MIIHSSEKKALALLTERGKVLALEFQASDLRKTDSREARTWCLLPLSLSPTAMLGCILILITVTF